ncbi:MAG: undecaprenyl/decaprenyl-phosphate alpha-N-acetylglucosaminyl 1-phosphate transferase [Bacteroidetes bacterium]|nr:undecaprenyl/decaprenyl-phosphate alpha-N-acetylglucosaminyl 1-phosphate transferase [Bacteroidota bacterium]
MAFLILVFITSFFVVLLSTPSLIKVAILKRLFDAPGDTRKLHTRMIPTIGGIIIFAGTLFAYSLWFPEQVDNYPQLARSINDYKFIVATLLVMFFVGVKDDIIGTAPVKKLVAHVLVGMVLVLMADIRIVSMHGLFGIDVLPLWTSVFLSLFTYIVVVNAFNLIDGVDGLAGGVGFIASSAFGAWFALAGDPAMACLAFALSGSLLAFLFFNFSPAKIFMGDSGSLTIGLIICILAIKVIGYDVSAIENKAILNVSKPIFAMAVLVYPLVDTLRIFIYRAVRGVSPFSADRNHLHHRLLDIGLSHKGTVITIYFFNIAVIGLTVALALSSINANYSLIIVAAVSLTLAQIPFFIKKKKNRTAKEND